MFIGDLSSTNPNKQKYLKIWKKNGRKWVYCKICVKFPDTVKLYGKSKNRKLPAIAQLSGTRYRPEIFKAHFSSDYHIACEKSYRLTKI